MITQINNSDIDEFSHWYLINPMDNALGYPFHPIINRLIITVQSPPEWNSLRTVYKKCINLTNLKVYLTKNDYPNQS